MSVAFGPGDDQLTLTSWSGIRTLDLRNGKVTPIPPPTFRDQFMRHSRWTGRLCQASRGAIALRSS